MTEPRTASLLPPPSQFISSFTFSGPFILHHRLTPTAGCFSELSTVTYWRPGRNYSWAQIETVKDMHKVSRRGYFQNMETKEIIISFPPTDIFNWGWVASECTAGEKAFRRLRAAAHSRAKICAADALLLRRCVCGKPNCGSSILHGYRDDGGERAGEN